jgi:Ca2+-binding EF-hand superfamily protein
MALVLQMYDKDDSGFIDFKELKASALMRLPEHEMEVISLSPSVMPSTER